MSASRQLNNLESKSQRDARRGIDSPRANSCVITPFSAGHCTDYKAIPWANFQNFGRVLLSF
jgi:hypothetical protein